MNLLPKKGLMNTMQKKLLPMMLVPLFILLCHQTASAYYDPGVQRWINRDPIAEDGGPNLYCFVLNEPVLSLDGFGESILDDLKDPCSKSQLDKLEKGAKCYAEWEKHMEKLRAACKKLTDLEEKLKNTKGPKARRPIEEEIERLKKAIKGHEKEIKQKWPKGPPCQCP
jgi:hypothetical protein